MKEITTSRMERWQKSHVVFARRKRAGIRVSGWMLPWKGADYDNKSEGEE